MFLLSLICVLCHCRFVLMFILCPCLVSVLHVFTVFNLCPVSYFFSVFHVSADVVNVSLSSVFVNVYSIWYSMFLSAQRPVHASLQCLCDVWVSCIDVYIVFYVFSSDYFSLSCASAFVFNCVFLFFFFIFYYYYFSTTHIIYS